jgi:hypothetical protein
LCKIDGSDPVYSTEFVYLNTPIMDQIGKIIENLPKKFLGAPGEISVFRNGNLIVIDTNSKECFNEKDFLCLFFGKTPLSER